MRTAWMAAAVLIGGWAAQLAPAQGGSPAAGDAERLYRERMRDPVWGLDYSGETFAWHAAYGMGGFVEGYEATGDTTFLDWGVKYYDALIAKMAEGRTVTKAGLGRSNTTTSTGATITSPTRSCSMESSILASW